MKTLAEAVKACKGVWPSDAKPGMLVGWNGLPDGDNDPPHYICLKVNSDWGLKIYRHEFEAEARRQGYADGFEGHPDDCAFKDGMLPPIGTKAVCVHTNEAHLIVAHDLLSDEPMALTVDESGYWGAMAHHWSPLKSDRERWVEAADKLVSSVDAGPYLMLETVYDALISGELPTPEAR